MDGTATEFPDCIALSATADVPASVYGARAGGIVDLMRAKLPVPNGWVFSVETVKGFPRHHFPEPLPMVEHLTEGRLFSVRCSPIERDWGGPEALLNIGMTPKVRDMLIKPLGRSGADRLFYRFVQDFAVQVARMDAEDFEDILEDCETDGQIDFDRALSTAFAMYEDDMDAPFPIEPSEQLRQALRSMANSWNGASARILRQAKGAPSDAGLGIIVQEMVLGLGRGESGAGTAQFIHSESGAAVAFGRYRSQAQGREAYENDGRFAQFLAKDERGPSLEEVAPKAFEKLKSFAETARRFLCDDMQLEFTIQDGEVWLLDAVAAERSGRASIASQVRLVEDGLITRDDALLSIAPRRLSEVLHPQIDRRAKIEPAAVGIGASPGAATGQIVFSASAAQAAEARGEAAILVRFETSPDDIRGMHSARGILTERGGMTSHAAVVARTLGLPCVVGANGIDIDAREKSMKLPNGTVLRAGDIITLNGNTGDVIKGAAPLVEPDLSDAFGVFMKWADEVRTLGVRGNADTPQDVRMAQVFGVDGIGLVRTELMFFEDNRMTAMREVIFAEEEADREAALNHLLPMQRDDFIEMFSLMGEAPTCIRLLDPPLHEFLPSTREESQALAEAMDLPLSKVMARIDDLAEFNPMLGTRGVRLGITAPEIYDMQARAIFEAAIEVNKAQGLKISPEVMIPLISANREVEIVKARVDAVAAAVQTERGESLDYTLGVMVETPRAALRADEIARTATFFSFGTNDLTQMTYGLSRDDAGRFMREYVNENVYPEDPFHSLDQDGVGELIQIAIERGRSVNPALKVGLCGEHGGDPASVAFCHSQRFDYVSCSPFRTPIARLAAAQAALGKKIF